MSELMNTSVQGGPCRGHLLATVSAAALLIWATTGKARAEDADHPTVWIELGGQFEGLSDGHERLAPPFLSQFDHLHFDPILPLQHPLRYAYGEQGKVSFAPRGSDWVFAASVRYGRSNGRNTRNQQRAPITYPVTNVQGVKATGAQSLPYHLNEAVTNFESHTILDFQAGKDIGLGMFGSHSASLLSLGVRFAQFVSNNKLNINGVPDFTHRGQSAKYDGLFVSHHNYVATVEADRSFRGVGPSVSWDSSTPIVAQGDDGDVTVDWGVNASALFGRQKVRGHVNKTGEHYKTFGQVNYFLGISSFYKGIADSYHDQQNIDRSHSIVVPNIGGFAGLSFRYAAAKVSFGYRGDFFFGAMDGGTDARKTYNRNFFGPYATISIGLGG